MFHTAYQIYFFAVTGNNKGMKWVLADKTVLTHILWQNGEIYATEVLFVKSAQEKGWDGLINNCNKNVPDSPLPYKS